MLASSEIALIIRAVNTLPPRRTLEAFRVAAALELQPKLQIEPTEQRLRRLRELALLAGRAIHLDWGFDLPNPAISDRLLDVAAEQVQAIEWLQSKISFDDDRGCWQLPLNAEYDTKNRARYPTLSSARFEAKGELAHRFVVRRLLGPLESAEHLDHICRSHACCNPTHLEIVTHSINTRRGHTARKSSIGQARLF